MSSQGRGSRFGLRWHHLVSQVTRATGAPMLRDCYVCTKYRYHLPLPRRRVRWRYLQGA